MWPLVSWNKPLALPAYDQCMKASHYFNMLDARGVISVTERAAYIGQVRALARGCCEAWIGGVRRCRMADLLIELVGEEIPARMQTMAAQHFATAVKTALDNLGVWTDAASIDGCVGRDIWPFMHAALRYLSLIV